MNRRETLEKELNMECEDYKIDARSVSERVNRAINADLKERKAFMRRKVLKTSLIAAAAAVLSVTTALAATSVGRETLGNIISYFSSDKAVEMTSLEELSRYNETIGASDTRHGYTLTLDNVACDDNYLHIFYTIKSDKKLVEDMETQTPTEDSMWVETLLDGKMLIGGNHTQFDSYPVDCYTVKYAEKLNVAAMDIPDSFNIELFGIKKSSDDEMGAAVENLFSRNKNTGGEFTFTDEDRANIPCVSADIDKSAVRVNTVTKELDYEFEYKDSDGGSSTAVIKKIVFSPFADQFVIEDENGGGAAMTVSSCAMTDDKGNYLDILNTGLIGGREGEKCVNAFEFLKGSPDMKSFTLIPVTLKESNEQPRLITQKVGEALPMVFEESEYGKVVITDIRISDGEIDIDYYKDGFVMYDPCFVLLDENGDNAEPGGKLGCTLYTDVHYDTNSYTARYVYEKYDGNGQRMKINDSVKKEALENSFKNIGIYVSAEIALEFDKAITVSLD